MYKFLSLYLLLFLSQNVTAQVSAICAYEKGFIRQSPSQKAEVVQTISFGKEKVFLAEEQKTVAEERNRIYEKVTTEEGETGWIWQEVLVREGYGAVVMVSSLISPQANENPHGGFVGEFQAGEVIIKMEQEGRFVKVYGFEKKKEGWILVENTMESEEEIAEAVWFTRALKENTDCERAEKMQAILRNPAFEINQMTAIIENAFQKADTLCKNPQQVSPKMPEKVDANNRGLTSQQPKPSKPTSPKSNTATPNKGKVVATPASPKPYEKKITPAPKTSAANSRTISPASKTPAKVKGTAANISPISKLEGQVGDAHKYTERLQMVEVTDKANANKLQCYHNTLPKGAKIMLQLPNNEGEIELEVIGGLKTKAGLGLTNPTIKRIFGEKIPRFVDIYYLAK